MAIVVMFMEDDLLAKLSEEAQVSGVAFQNQLSARFKQFLRVTAPHLTEKQPELSDKQVVLQKLIHTAMEIREGEYSFAEVVQKSGMNFSSAEVGTLGSMFANTTKKTDSPIQNLGKIHGSKVTLYINKVIPAQ